ncbi:MAG: DNA-directed RNA polymerase subunit omega [Mucinivorans sp.]
MKQRASNTETRTLSEIDASTGNIYESVVIMARRAAQLSKETKDELTQKLADFAGTSDNLEETFENREQIEISRFYERQAKATLTATDEFLEGKLVEIHADEL